MEFLTKQEKESYTGKKVLVRLDCNVPVIDGKITGDFRLRKSLETIMWLHEAGAKIILISHIKNKEGSTLVPVYEWFAQNIQKEIFFIKDIFDTEAIEKETVSGKIVLVENIRNWDGEENNDSEFAKHLASLADLFVQDAFSVSHREHASIVGVPEFLPTVYGCQVEKEIAALSKVFDPKHPLVMVFGGIKFETKLPLIEKYLDTADNLLLVGGMANDVYMDADKYSIGTSMYSKEVDVAYLAEKSSVETPDMVSVENESGTTRLADVTDIRADECIMDSAPEGIEKFRETIMNAGTIVWNGPLGWYEKGYDEGTKAMAQMIAESDAYSVVGGGDTIAAIEQLGLQDNFDFLSTGGGAMLEYLEKEGLVGLK